MVNNNYNVVGAKAGDKPRQPNIAKDSVSSISTAKILYGLNDGEISGIVGGGKGIKLEDTPLLDEAGKENFKGVKWDFRSGTLDQEYIEGFPDISNETGVSVELKSGVDWIKAISNPVLSAVRIRLSWNGLRKQNTENGDVSGYKIDYAIDVKTGSGAYIEVLKTNINDKVTGKYERTHRIALPKSSNGWQIRVRRLTPNANLDNIQDKMFIESITEVIDQKFTYPHTALLGIQYDAKTFSRIAKVAIRARGKLIKIPSNYNSAANTYTGVWNGQFKLEYSNNPAWIFYDLVTSKRYGLGKRIDPSMVDKWSLYDLGAYCDALVPDGQGSTEKRYTCNVYLQSQEDAYKILSQLSGIFRAITYWSGQQLVLSADVPKDPTYTFTRANVIDGNFEYTGTRARDRHTVAKVAFDNPKENFKTEYEYIRDEAGIAKFGINVIDISAIGCTSRGQAQRAGLWALKSEQLETRTVSFRTGLEGFNILVGEVIEVSDELLAGRANGGRVTAVDATFKKVTVDREAVIKVNDFITVNAKDGTSQRRKVTAVSGKLVTVLSPFVGVEAGAVWAISSVDLNTMQFRVMSVKPDEDNIFSITAIQHEPLKYAAVDHGASVKPTNISIIKPTNVAPPASVALSANYRVIQGQSVATLVIQWSQVKDAVGYAVEWRRNDGNWIKIPLTGNVSAEVEGVYEGNYQARVKSVNAFDVESDFTNSIITNIKGKVGNPKALASISATGILFGMDIKWNFLAGSEDTNYTEIQTATDASGANTALLGSFSYPTDKTTVNGLQGGLTVFYRGRIVDKLGNYSAWSNWISGTTDNDAGKVLEILTGQITESQLYKDLNTKIAKIQDNTSAIAGVTIDVSGITTDLNTAKTNIATAQGKITAAEANIASNLTKVNAATTSASNANTAVTAANTKIAESKVLIDANKAKLVLTDAEVAAAKTKVSALETDYNGNKVTVSNTLTALANKDTSFSQDLTALTTDFNGNKTTVSNSLTALTNKDTALGQQLTALDTDYKGNKTSVSSSLTALTNKDTALGQQLTALDTDYKGNKTAVSDSLTSLTNADTALGSRITTLDTDYKGNKTTVTNSLTALSNKDTALTNSLTALTTSVGNNTTSISTLNTAMSTANEAIATSKTDLTAKFNEAKTYTDLKSSVLVIDSKTKKFINPANYANNASSVTGYLVIETPITPSRMCSIKIGGYNYNTSQNTVGLTVGFYNTTTFANTGYESFGSFKISSVQLAKKDADNKAVLIIGLDTTKWSFPKIVVEEALVGHTASPDSYTEGWNIVIKTDISEYTNLSPVIGVDIQNTLIETNAAITTEASARATADTAITSSVTTLKSDYDTNKASVTNSLSTLTNKDTALTNSINALTTRVGTAEATITTNNTASVNKDTAFTNSLNTLTTDYNGNKTTVSNNLTALATADTALGNRITATDSIAKNAQSRVGTVETTVASNTQAIAQTKTDLVAQFKVDENLFSIADCVAGYESAGEISNSTPNHQTMQTLMPITGSSVLTFQTWNINKVTSNNSNRIAYFTANKVYISSSASIKNLNGTVYYKTTLTPPTDARFIRIGVIVGSGDIDTSISIKVEEGAATAWKSNSIDTINNVAAIRTEATSRATEDSALSGRIDTVTATAGTNKTNITTEINARTTADTALGNRITATDAIAKNAQARVGTAETSLATATGAIATLRQDLVASYTIQDTRTTDELPQYYYTNFPRQTVQEFKNNSVFPTVVGAGTYIFLETNVKWSSAGGGSITQKAITDDNRFYIRMSASATAWKPWLEQEDVIGSAAKVEAARKALDTKIGATDARVTAEKKVASDATSALASTVNTLQTSVEESTVLYFYNLGKDHPNWNKDYSGSGESSATSTVWTIGNNSGDDQRWLIRKDNIPLIDGQIYRISCKYRNVSGSGTTYVGVAGIAANGTTWVAANGSNNPTSGQYYVDSDSSTSTALDEAYGYICSAGTDTTGLTGVKKLHANCQFFRPLLITNYPNVAGSTQFDWFKVEAVDKTNTASIQTAQTSLNGLSAQYTVKVDVGGRVSGFGLASTAIGATPISNFSINADKFYIAPPTGTSKGVSPFMVTTTTTTINGVSVPAGTYIESAHIHNGSIDIAKIRTASITSLQALTANIGHFKSAPTGARLEIKDSLLSVYDANNKLRVRLGLW